jgi:hypothetical protein
MYVKQIDTDVRRKRKNFFYSTSSSINNKNIEIKKNSNFGIIWIKYYSLLFACLNTTSKFLSNSTHIITKKKPLISHKIRLIIHVVIDY